MTKTFTIKDGQVPTQEQLEEVRAAAKREIQFDEDSPELSPAMFKAFKCTITQRNRILLVGKHPKPFEQPLAGAGCAFGKRTLTKEKQANIPNKSEAPYCACLLKEPFGAG